MTANQFNRIMTALDGIRLTIEGQPPKPPEKPKPISAKEVAAHYRVSVKTVLEWCHQKRIPHMRIGYIYRFPQEALNNFNCAAK